MGGNGSGKSGSGNSRNHNSENRRTVTFQLGQGEVGVYEAMLKELGVSLSYLMRNALKLMLVIFWNYKKGGTFKLLDKDGNNVTPPMLELWSVEMLNSQIGDKDKKEGGLNA